jgi:hypothetical protein
MAALDEVMVAATNGELHLCSTLAIPIAACSEFWRLYASVVVPPGS